MENTNEYYYKCKADDYGTYTKGKIYHHDEVGRYLNRNPEDWQKVSPFPTTELIREIDNMTQIELCRLWRHAPSDNKYITGLAGKYMSDRLYKHFDGFTPTISKSIGW